MSFKSKPRRKVPRTGGSPQAVVDSTAPIMSKTFSLRGKLSQAGYKLTKPRLAVLECLKKQDNLLSARDLHKEIKTVDQASVYRTLRLLEELNIVNSETINKEKLYCLADHPHHHIICRSCGYNEEFPCTEEEKYKSFKNFKKIHHQLTLTGVCNKCFSRVSSARDLQGNK